MTIFTSKIFTPPLRGVARIFMKAGGWTCSIEAPMPKKFVAVIAPHTSNWDFLYFLATALVLELDAKFVGKHTLFKGPLGPIMRWCSGIPVNRSTPDSIINDAVAFFEANETAILAVAPEGTRSKVNHWKSGFYRIAMEANVAVVPAWLCYKTKTAGVSTQIKMTGDKDTDMATIQAFFAPMVGKKPQHQTPS